MMWIYIIIAVFIVGLIVWLAAKNKKEESGGQ